MKQSQVKLTCTILTYIFVKQVQVTPAGLELQGKPSSAFQVKTWMENSHKRAHIWKSQASRGCRSALACYQETFLRLPAPRGCGSALACYQLLGVVEVPLLATSF